jgi:hypothetical protein
MNSKRSRKLLRSGCSMLLSSSKSSIISSPVHGLITRVLVRCGQASGRAIEDRLELGQVVIAQRVEVRRNRRRQNRRELGIELDRLRRSTPSTIRDELGGPFTLTRRRLGIIDERPDPHRDRARVAAPSDGGGERIGGPAAAVDPRVAGQKGSHGTVPISLRIGNMAKILAGRM